MLAVASAGTVVASLAWAWATSDFWETVPLLPCVGMSGVLAALAVYTARKGAWAAAVFVGVAVAVATFFGALFITLARWEGS